MNFLRRLSLTVTILVTSGLFGFVATGSSATGIDEPAIVRAQAAPVTVQAIKGSTTTFTFDGAQHAVELLSVTGESALVEFTSEPSQVVLSTTQSEPVDLTGDTVPEATASLTAVAATAVTIELVGLPTGAWDESGFKTAGGLRPWDAEQARNSSALVSDGHGGVILFTVTYNRMVGWQRFKNDGTFIKSPIFGAGTLEPPVSDRYRVNTLDAAAVPGGYVVATELRLYGSGTNKGVALTPYDEDLRQIGPPLIVGGWRPRLAYDGHELWLVTTDRYRLSLTEISVGSTLAPIRTITPISPPEGWIDGQPDIAINPSTDDVVVVWGRFDGGSEPDDVHLAVVSQVTGEMGLETVIPTDLAGDGYSAQWDAPDVLVASGTATIAWRYGNPNHVLSAKVDLDTGNVGGRTDQPWSAVSGSWALLGEMNLAKVAGVTRLVGLLVHVKEIGGLWVPRYRAYRRNSTGFVKSPAITFEGGFPVRADVLMDLEAWSQVPEEAVVGAETVVEGAVINRGTRSASGVTVDVTAAGGLVGTVSLGSLDPFERVPIAVGWTVPEGTTADEIPVALQVRTTSDQYTKGNDVARHSLRVLQHGVITGWVMDDSADINHTSDYSPGLPNANVSVGSLDVLTNLDGYFKIDDIPFGVYPVGLSVPGYKPVSGQVEVTPTHPFGTVVLRTDDHGILEVNVKRANGTALSGADVTLVEARHRSTTPTSGKLVYDISAGTYRIAVTKRGYTGETARLARVDLDETTVEPFTLTPATSASVTGKVVDARGVGVSGATVDVIDNDVTGFPIIKTATTAGDGSFGPLSLPAGTSSHSYALSAKKNGNPYTGGDVLNIYGGDVTSTVLALLPPAEESQLQGVSASEGYTSWMIHPPGFPGFAFLPSADIYTWMGNYGVKVSAEYWDDSHELVGIDVSVQGNSYESHATKSEIDFTEMQGSDFGDLFETAEIEEGPIDVGGFFLELATDHINDAIDLAGDIADLLDPFDEAEVGQGARLLTWKEAKEDFRVIPEFDSSNPIKSVFEILVSIPRSFAIPIVIGGSSLELTSVRVDQIDVVDAETYEVLWSSEPSPESIPDEWFSWQGPDGDGGINTERYIVDVEGIDMREVFVEVFLNIGKIRPSSVGGGNPDVYGTAFSQREQQVVIFRPGTKAMIAQIAPGDLYRHGERIRPEE